MSNDNQDMMHSQTIKVIQALFDRIHQGTGDTVANLGMFAGMAALSQIVISGSLIALPATGLATFCGGLAAAEMVKQIHNKVYLPLARMYDAISLSQKGIETADGQYLNVKHLYELIQPIQKHIVERQGLFCRDFNPSLPKHVRELIEYMDENGDDSALKSLLSLGCHPEDLPSRIVDQMTQNRQIRRSHEVKKAIEENLMKRDSLLYNFQNAELLYPIIDNNVRQEVQDSFREAKPKIHRVF